MEEIKSRYSTRESFISELWKKQKKLPSKDGKIVSFELAQIGNDVIVPMNWHKFPTCCLLLAGATIS